MGVREVRDRLLVTIQVTLSLRLPLMQITLEVPDRLGEQLQQLGDRLPEVFERAAAETLPYQDDNQIVELLASQHPPHTCIANPHERIAAVVTSLLTLHLEWLVSISFPAISLLLHHQRHNG